MNFRYLCDLDNYPRCVYLVDIILNFVQLVVWISVPVVPHTQLIILPVRGVQEVDCLVKRTQAQAQSR